MKDLDDDIKENDERSGCNNLFRDVNEKVELKKMRKRIVRMKRKEIEDLEMVKKGDRWMV